MNILQRLEEGFKNSQPQQYEKNTQDYLYEKLKTRLEQGIPDYIIKNKKTIVDILEEKLNMVIIKENNEHNERNISEQQICEHTNQQQQQ